MCACFYVLVLTKIAMWRSALPKHSKAIQAIQRAQGRKACPLQILQANLVLLC